jgi:hypothetical protein
MVLLVLRSNDSQILNQNYITLQLHDDEGLAYPNVKIVS